MIKHEGILLRKLLSVHLKIESNGAAAGLDRERCVVVGLFQKDEALSLSLSLSYGDSAARVALDFQK